MREGLVALESVYNRVVGCLAHVHDKRVFLGNAYALEVVNIDDIRFTRHIPFVNWRKYIKSLEPLIAIKTV